jgi:membrane protein DedA with SNARE-associated domain
MDHVANIDLRAIADAIGYPAAGLGILIESAGIPFPGETMLLAVAAYSAAGSLDIRLVVPFGAMGAIMGADLGYAVGYFGGRPFVERLSRFLRLSARHLARAELFFARHGAPTIFVARFVPGLRSWASMMAGMARMPFWTFQAYTAIGGIAWAIVIGSIGFYLGSNWSLIERVAGYLGLGGLAVGATLAVVLFLLWRRTARS